MAASVAAVVVAAGRGLRAGGDMPKQYRELAGEPVIRPADGARFGGATVDLKLLAPVFGGATRQASVRAGLEALAALRPDVVLIHDAARPYASVALVSRAIAAVEATGAAVPVMPVADTVKSVDASGLIEGTLDRTKLRTVQTPQVFAFAPVLEAHRRAAASAREDFTDDAALAEWAGLKVAVFAGEAGNLKLTTPDDVARAERDHAMALADTRTGSGFDVHAFAPGDHVMLGGVKIPHERGVIGHSDADVALHALTDAVLGALAEGDIGSHFPPRHPHGSGASSDRFLAFAVERVRARGGRIAHLDLTIVCEAPRTRW